MEIDLLKQALIAKGISCRDTQNSMSLNFCPSCETRKFKVYFSYKTVDSGFFGKCFRASCGEGFSIRKYLALVGLPGPQIDLITGGNPDIALMSMDVKEEELFSSMMLASLKEVHIHEVEVEDVKEKSKAFFDISSWPDHPASLYAKRRGVDPVRHKKAVQIDPDGNAVVFMCYDGDELVGYQRRFLNPDFEHMKTKTSKGFPAHKNIIYLPNPGKDIWICEGPFTAISAHNYGYAAVCTFGAGVGLEQLRKIEKLVNSEGVSLGIAYDADEAGEKGADKIKRYCFWTEIRYYHVRPEVGSDLNDSWMAGKGVIVEPGEDFNPAIPSVGIGGIL